MEKIYQTFAYGKTPTTKHSTLYPVSGLFKNHFSFYRISEPF